MAKKPAAKKAPKASKNPVGDFLKGEADKRKLPVVTEQKPKIRGTPNRAKTPGVMNQGHTPGSASRAVVPYKAPASKFASVGKFIGRTAAVAGTVGRIANPVGALVAMTTATGDGKEDKPSGGLMKGNSGIKAKAGAKAGVSASGKGSAAVSTPKATPAPKPKARPSVAPPKPTARPSMAKGSSSPPAYTPEKAQKRGNVTSGFSGNWTGAAPSEMQKRGGARINKGGGLLGKIRKK